jgi:hypothetical protein
LPRKPGKGQAIDRGLPVGEDFGKLPTDTKVDFLADTNRLKRWLKPRRNNPYRWKIGTFSLPETGLVMHQKLVLAACKKFVENVRQQDGGWTLASRLSVSGPYRGHDLETGKPLEGKTEYKVTAVFKKENIKELRIELPPGIVKKDPEQTITLSEAIRIG